jgi:hypothetical protein
MKYCCAWMLLALMATLSPAAEPNLGFRPAAEAGYFQFDTGTVRGKIRLNGAMQGVTEVIHIPTGVDVAKGGNLPGLFSYYRVLTTGTRHGHNARDWATVAKVLPDGALEVSFASGEDHPLELTAIHRWVRPDTLDVETIVEPQQDMPQFEMFMSNYFPEDFEVLVYLKPGLDGKGPGVFVPVNWWPLIDGTYVMFPRDREACMKIYDGRWAAPENPVQWSVTRHLAAPMAMRRSAARGVAALMMSPPEDCFAVGMSYDKTPPDRVSGHYALYQSLFGRDLAAGETACARMRLVVGPIPDEKAADLYQEYLKELK